MLLFADGSVTCDDVVADICADKKGVLVSQICDFAKTSI
jgi:hypothetical protein